MLYFNSDNVFFENIFIVSKIKDLVKNYDYKYEDIAILFRKNYLLEPLKDNLFYENIPFLTKDDQKNLLEMKKSSKIKSITCRKTS
ncbi:3'-5' exonuclease [Candidatus Phytoplasma sp. AldY-WA1]|uniref:3'-5' exonuclease n=1 Tax=Candidatus Phytoplasma sp. AldY-WA1 TaxID=2852100 RepID=UPI00403E1991